MNTKLIDSLVLIINALNEEERKQLEEKLSTQIIPTDVSSNLEDEPFVGIWKDRENMEDSSQWVRIHRQQEWLKEF